MITKNDSGTVIDEIYSVLLKLIRILCFASLFIPILSCLHTVFGTLTSTQYASEYCTAAYYITYMNGVRSRALLGTLFSFLFPDKYFMLFTCIFWHITEEIIVIILYLRVYPLFLKNSPFAVLYGILLTAISFFPMISTLFQLRSDLYLILCYAFCIILLNGKKNKPFVTIILCSMLSSLGIMIHPVFFLSYVPFLIILIKKKYTLKKSLLYLFLPGFSVLFIISQPKADFSSLSRAVHLAQDHTDYNKHIQRFMLSGVESPVHISDTTDSFLYSSYCSNETFIPTWRLASVFSKEFIKGCIRYMLSFLPMLIPSFLTAVWLFWRSSDRFHLVILLFYGFLFLTQLDFIRWIMMFISGSIFLDAPQKEPSRNVFFIICIFHCLSVFFSMRALI